MNRQLYEELRRITLEEEQILKGKHQIERSLYTSGSDSGELGMVEAERLLEEGRLIQVRKHTRFVHFPKHTHNFVEMIYMCSGQTHHRINEEDVILKEGELLMLNQRATQEIFPAGRDDVAINFIVLPEFFDYGIRMMSQEPNTLRDFVIDCLRGEGGSSGYLHFRVADVLPVQNLIENLIWTIYNRQPNKRSINQATMGLLFLQLMNHMDRLETGASGGKEQLVITVLQYVEEHYRDGELSELAAQLHYDFYWLSREIKRQTGQTYTELVQRKRLNQAAYYLKNTSMSVLDIGLAVGYENQSYFHRIFQKQFGTTPRKYRVEENRRGSIE